jgi:hypothetical protein
MRKPEFSSMSDENKPRPRFRRGSQNLDLDLDEIARLGNQAALKAGMLTIGEGQDTTVAQISIEPTASAQPPSPPPGPVVHAHMQRLPVSRPNDGERARVTVELPKELVDRLKHAVIDAKCTIRDFVEAAIERSLS